MATMSGNNNNTSNTGALGSGTTGALSGG